MGLWNVPLEYTIPRSKVETFWVRNINKNTPVLDVLNAVQMELEGGGSRKNTAHLQTWFGGRFGQKLRKFS